MSGDANFVLRRIRLELDEIRVRALEVYTAAGLLRRRIIGLEIEEGTTVLGQVLYVVDVLRGVAMKMKESLPHDRLDSEELEATTDDIIARDAEPARVDEKEMIQIYEQAHQLSWLKERVREMFGDGVKAHAAEALVRDFVGLGPG